MGGYIRTMSDVDKENGCIKEGEKRWRRLQLNFGIDSIRAPGEKMNSIVIIRGGVWEESRLWVGKVLILPKLFVARDGRGWKYAFLQFLEAVHPKVIVDETLGSVCLRRNTDGEADHSHGKEACSSKQGHLTVGE